MLSPSSLPNAGICPEATVFPVLRVPRQGALEGVELHSEGRTHCSPSFQGIDPARVQDTAEGMWASENDCHMIVQRGDALGLLKTLIL